MFSNDEWCSPPQIYVQNKWGPSLTNHIYSGCIPFSVSVLEVCMLAHWPSLSIIKICYTCACAAMTNQIACSESDTLTPPCRIICIPLSAWTWCHSLNVCMCLYCMWLTMTTADNKDSGLHDNLNSQTHRLDQFSGFLPAHHEESRIRLLFPNFRVWIFCRVSECGTYVGSQIQAYGSVYAAVRVPSRADICCGCKIRADPRAASVLSSLIKLNIKMNGG